MTGCSSGRWLLLCMMMVSNLVVVAPAKTKLAGSSFVGRFKDFYHSFVRYSLCGAVCTRGGGKHCKSVLSLCSVRNEVCTRSYGLVVVRREGAEIHR